MRLRYTELKGLEVLAEKEGSLLGTVRKLLIDSKRKTVTGLVFKGRGIAGERWAKADKVLRVGKDVVFLSDEKAQRDSAPAGRDAREMLGLPITSLDGKNLGALDDLVVDLEQWSIAALVMDDGGEVDLDKDSVFGEDTILLQKGAHENVRGGGSASQGGFLARVFSQDEGVAARRPAKKTSKKTPRRKKKTKA